MRDGGLAISIGQYSDRGRKPSNQDFFGALIPALPGLDDKGISVALADGISSSSVSRVAAETAVKSFLTDYYCTSETWSVKTSGHRVISAANAWLHAQSRRHLRGEDREHGYVCTLSVVVFKAATAHIFHVGDARVYRLNGRSLEQLTEDHRVAVAPGSDFLGRALGVNPQIEIDYRAVPIATGDIFVLATDGIYEHVRDAVVADTIMANSNDLDVAARQITNTALANGSPDNATVQVIRIDGVSMPDASEVSSQSADLPMPPLLEPRQEFDGYRIIRTLHASSRSHIFLAADASEDRRVALKIPSQDLRGDANHMKRFALEEWVARRVDNAHVLRPHASARPRGFLYVAMEYVDGQTLRQWMIDNPRPPLDAVRGILEQIANGLRAFHRKEMLHQDLRPDNIMIDRTGTVKIIDFGSVRIAGVAETLPAHRREEILGTAQYTAPEYFVGARASRQSDLFSLGVIAYQMLTGRLPYGAKVARAQTWAGMRLLQYVPAREMNANIPAWVDSAIARAVSIDPDKRHEALSEFIEDLRTPNPRYGNARPLIESHLVRVWQGLTTILIIANLVLLYLLRK
jgi:serine/threonine protein phosphatase PrpC